MLPKFPKKVVLANLPTPFRPLDRVSQSIGGPRIWLKCDDQTGSLLSGNKVRKLEYIIAHALEEGCDTLITCGGLQSNHCRATALAGAQLGMKVHLVLRGQQQAPLDGNLLLDKLAGASVSIYAPKDYLSGVSKKLLEWKNHYIDKGHHPWIIPTGASDGMGIWGYLSASRELLDDFERADIEPEWVVCASGSGGTQAGLSLGLALQNSTTRVMGMAVCDSQAYFDSKVRKDIQEWRAYLPGGYLAAYSDRIEGLAVNTNAKYIGPGYGQAEDEVYACISWLAREEGVILDPVYTGKAFFGLMNEIKNGKFSECKNIVFVHTGGVFGIYPHKTRLMENCGV